MFNVTAAAAWRACRLNTQTQADVLSLNLMREKSLAHCRAVSGRVMLSSILATDYKKGRPYSITERRVLELIPVLGSQPAGDVSHKPGGGLALLSARPAVTLATLKKAATSFAA